MSNREPTDLRTFLASARASATSAGQGVRAVAAAVLSLDEMRARRGAVEDIAPARFCRDQLAGRLVELSGVGPVAALSAAIGLVLEAQEQGEPAAWITLPPSTFYPPDLADSGV